MFEVPRTIGPVREEVKDGAIVPEIDGRHRPLASNVRLNPGNRRVGQSRLGTVERRAGNVNDAHAPNTASDQSIHEAGIPAPHIDYSTVAGQAGRIEQP
jgi:hypothetical protein